MTASSSGRYVLVAGGSPAAFEDVAAVLRAEGYEVRHATPQDGIVSTAVASLPNAILYMTEADGPEQLQQGRKFLDEVRSREQLRLTPLVAIVESPRDSPVSFAQVGFSGSVGRGALAAQRDELIRLVESPLPFSQPTGE